ncbi:MAG: Pr6Pr family membrane protein [Clostridia bacterium]|nr:Pr6Pr family membrane protein [Clostridia bacterium]
MNRSRSVWEKNPVGVILLFFAVLIAASVVCRVIFYRFEYDAQYYPVDYGRFNYFSYFTIQSNLMVMLYCFFAALAIFGVRRVQWIRKPGFGLFVTTYILITGAVYCSGFPMGLTPPLVWDTAYHCMLNSFQILHHMIMPPVMLFFWLLQGTEPPLRARLLPAVGIYPFIYSLLCIARGAFVKPTFYTYPFYNPGFLVDTVFPGKSVSPLMGYVIMLPLLIVGIGLFILVAAILFAIHNAQCKRRGGQSNEKE